MTEAHPVPLSLTQVFESGLYTETMSNPTHPIFNRWPAVQPVLAVGTVWIIAGGLIAALSGPTDFEAGSWVAAYLVLVGGVAQVALGVGQAWISRGVPNLELIWKQIATWNLAGVAVVAGTLLESPMITTLGGAVLAAALVLYLVGVRQLGTAPTWVGLVYRAVALIVLVSIPVGLTLSWIRH